MKIAVVFDRLIIPAFSIDDFYVLSVVDYPPLLGGNEISLCRNIVIFSVAMLVTVTRIYSSSVTECHVIKVPYTSYNMEQDL